VVDLAADVLGIVLGDEPDVIDKVGEERGDDATIARLNVGGGGRAAPDHGDVAQL
jgi:hypothetical protein